MQDYENNRVQKSTLSYHMLSLYFCSMSAKANHLFIKNMVCNRCIMAVENILNQNNVPYLKVSLGEAELERKLSAEETMAIDADVQKVGFELIDKRVNKIIEEIKQAALKYLNLGMDSQNLKLSSFITKNAHSGERD
jgi:AraC family transcriptional regulator